MNKYFKNINLTLIAVVFFSITGCMKPGVELKKSNCPQPEQNCYPMGWTGIPIDTSFNLKNNSDWYYKIEIVNGINTSSDEWQISKTTDKNVLTYTDGDIQKCLYVRMVNVNQFSPLKGIELPIDRHYGSLSTMKDKIVFAMSNVSGKGTNKVPVNEAIGNSRIFTGELYGDRIVNVKNIFKNSINNDLDWYAQPSVFPKREIIFFASDRDGGLGGSDIWYSYKIDKDSWSYPINAGNKINTQCDELTPFVSPKGDKLYFSSSGRKTVGGYDLFVSQIKDEFINNYKDSTKTDTFFNFAENLKSPLNTKNDEMFPYIPENSDVLYYSSNQYNINNDNNKSGGFDIYVFHKVKVRKNREESKATKPKEEIIEKNEEKKAIEISEKKSEPETLTNTSEKLTLRGKVMEMNTLIPVDSARIDLVKLPGNKKDTSIFSNKQGDYNLDILTNTDYQLTAQKGRFYFDSKRVFIEPKDIKKEVNFYLPEQGNIRINFPLDEYKNPYKYTLDSNGIETGRTWMEEIEMIAENILMTKDRIDKVILVGHTDDIADDEYNNKLGQRRVDFVINELVKQGVPKNILISRSAGKLEPLPKHNDENIDTYRKRLRRVTLEKILK
jgi:hypothetical protein